MTNKGIGAALIAALLLLPGCHRMTEAEALEAAREEVRQEMQPEIDRRQREIEDLKRQIAAARARIAAQKSRRESGKSP